MALPRVKPDTWWHTKDDRRRLWVLPKDWGEERVYYDYTPDVYPCMTQGYNRTIQWLTAATLIKEGYQPFRHETDRSFMPSWIQPRARFAWTSEITPLREDLKELLELHLFTPCPSDGEVAVVRRRSGWVIVASMSPLEDYFHEEWLLSKTRLLNRFIWSEQRFTCAFMNVTDLQKLVKPVAAPTIWDRLMLAPVY